MPAFNSAGTHTSPNVLVAETTTQTLTNKTIDDVTLTGDLKVGSVGSEAMGTSGQILKVNSSGNGLEWGDASVFTGTTANGLLTYDSASNANVESNITFSGQELNVTGSITSSGTVTYGTLNDGTTNLTATISELNILDGVTATATELNKLDGLTSTTTELNKLDGVTATASEINRLDITTLGSTENSKVVTADSSGHVYFKGTNA